MCLLSSQRFIAHFLPDTTGVSVTVISPEQINSFITPVHLINEQKLIAAFLLRETHQLNTLVTEAQSVAAPLQERHSVLISAAVNDKIDVCGCADCLLTSSLA